MGQFKSKVVGNIICSEVSGELDVKLATEWIIKLEEQEASSNNALHRFHDVRNINAVHLSFDDLWAAAQRRLGSYESGNETLSIFLVSTPLNYGISRMYQALTDGTPFKIEVLYKLDEAAEYLGVEQSILESIKY